jgi:excisionase family DNA binding protein
LQDTATSSTRQPKSPHSTKEFLSVRELSELLSVTDRTAANWVGRGVLPSARIGGIRRVRPADIEALFEEERKAS